MEELATLVSKRGRIKAKLTRLNTFFDSILPTNAEQKLTELKLRFKDFEGITHEFANIQDEIEDVDSSAAQLMERDTFEDSYFALTAKIVDFINAHTTVSNHQQSEADLELESNASRHSHSAHIKLPALDLPRFSGAYDEWLPFYDYFKATVDQNEDLSDVQKMRYLKSCCKGEAAGIIGSVSITEQNYQVALQLLVDRYHNLNYIIYRHIKELFNIPLVREASASTVQRLLDDTMKNLRALENLKQPVGQWDTLIVYLTTSKFDPDTYKLWEEKWSGKLASLADLTEFLEHRCRVLHSCNNFNSKSRNTIQRSDKKIEHPVSKDNRSYVSTQASNPNKQSLCSYCKGNHPLYYCPDFLHLAVNDRIKSVHAQKLCFNCLRPKHTSNMCRSSKCPKCDGLHNSLLHVDKSATTVHKDIHTNQSDSNSRLSAVVNNSNIDQIPSSTTHILLSTAIIRIMDAQGGSITCRALLDCASHISFICRALANRLMLPMHTIDQPINGIGNSSVSVHEYVTVKLSSLDCQFQSNLKLLILPKITDRLPSMQYDSSKIPIPAHINLADPHFHTPQKIDVLIGNDLFWDLMCTGHTKIANGSLHLQNTKLGWILGGKMMVDTSPPPPTCHVTTIEKIDQRLRQFWEIEHSPLPHALTGDEKKCEDHYVETTYRNGSGRYVVSFPFKKDTTELGDSRFTASKRFSSLENKLYHDPNLHSQYSKFMDEYIQLKHMEPVPEGEIIQFPYFYLPHHAILKESSSTSRIRVVYDGSSKTSSGVSLNQILMVGPIVQQDLFHILVRFRTHKYALTADIEKMYRQIELEPSQRNLQLILWRDSQSKPLKTYRLCTITYGTASASFLSTRTLIQLADDYQHEFPLASAITKRDFFVDDCLSGSSNFEEALELQTQLIQMMSCGGFPLRKWCSNDPNLINHLPPELRSFDDLAFTEDTKMKMLGLMWSPIKDSFLWNVNKISNCNTKRTMLSAIARIFDPLGLIGPTIVLAKIFLQRLWSQQLEWDDIIPEGFQREWDEFYDSLIHLDKIRIPRFIQSSDSNTICEIHGFSDASEKAFGACIYIKCVSPNGEVSVSLIAAKSRVAPKKQTTLPRLELCAAQLLSQLSHAVVQALNLEIPRVCYYTDSSIVLGWIRSESSHWSTFVANRIAQIQDTSSPLSWFHVSGKENPADIISRGSLIQDLIQCNLWWHGPTWLQNNTIQLSSLSDEISEEELPERRFNLKFISCLSFVKEKDLISRYSSLQKLVSVVGFCFRFLTNLKSPRCLRIKLPFLTVKERQHALYHVIKTVQMECFPLEYHALKSKRAILKGSQLLPLNCFMDKDEIIRVGGRLNLATHLAPDFKNPILLSPKSYLTKLIILDEHKKSLHAGLQLLLTIIRQTFWPINGLTVVKKTLKTCITCHRFKAQMAQQIMGNLPANRITPSRPFSITGVDYCGPFFIRPSMKRSNVTTKSYICIFVCFSTKAVHMELVEDLTAIAFLAAFKRFISRRGKPNTLYSDNATNFAKASSDLKELYELLSSSAHQANISSSLASQGIHWEFIPPASPHFGALWEAAVKSTKYHLRRVVGLTRLTYAELNTIVVHVESFLNSRPLTPLSSDPNDLSVLTPAHFLIGDSLTAPPEQDLKDLNQNRLTRWQLVQQLSQHIWTRWTQEYLSSLQQRIKWKTSSINLKIGSMVFIKDDNYSPLTWKLGRVVQLHPGSDGRVRVVSVKTSTGILKRTITKLCPLPEDQPQVFDSPQNSY